MIRGRTIAASLAAFGLMVSTAVQAKPVAAGQVRAASLVQNGKGSGNTGTIVGVGFLLTAVSIVIVASAGNNNPPPSKPSSP